MPLRPLPAAEVGVAALPVPVAVLAAVQAALHAKALRAVAFGPMVLSYLPAMLQRRAVDAATAATKANDNSWQEGDSTAAVFRSVDASTAEGPRPADGGLPGTDYLATRNGRGASMSGRWRLRSRCWPAGR